MGGNRRARGDSPGKDRSRPRLWFRKELRAKLSASISLSGTTSARVPPGGGYIEKILSRPHPGKGRKGRSSSRPPAWKPRSSHRTNPQGCAHLAHARCESCGGSGPRCRRDPCSSLKATPAAGKNGER